MAVILCIETSTTVCSTSLSKDGICLIEKREFEGPSHANLLNLFVQDMLDFAKANQLQLNAIAVSCGPGSYTGLRIGVSTAKGLCFGLNIPLIAINTLELMAHTVCTQNKIMDDSILCPMIDARRMEVYTAFYNQQLECIKATSADIIDENSYHETLPKCKMYFFGNGADKCKAVLTHPSAVFIDDIHPIAKNMINLAENAYTAKTFADLAYFEPFYLKDFVATTPKKKLF